MGSILIMKNIKGIAFTGCSFTWGQGLYFYSNLPRIVQSEDPNYWDAKWVSQAQLNYKDSIAYPRLVSNHFQTFEVTKHWNGGSNDDSIEFLESLFKYSVYVYEDFSYIVFQITDVSRDKHCEYSIKDLEKMYTSIDFTDSNVIHKISLDNIETLLRKYEALGIKTYLLNWRNNIVDLINKNNWAKKRLVTFLHGGVKYDCIEDLMNSSPNLTIRTDVENLGKQYNDNHPSKTCHRIIADSIIKKIEDDNL